MTQPGPASAAQHATFEMALPRQHGAWSALAASYLLGALGTADPTPATALLVLPLLAAFVAQNTLARWVRLATADRRRPALLRWALGLTVSALLVGLVLVLGFGIDALIPLGALAAGLAGLALWSEWRRRARTAAMEAVGMFALTLAAPAAAVTTRSGLTTHQLGLWLLAGLLFVGSITRVRYLVRDRRQRQGPLEQRLRVAVPALVFHLGGWVVLLALASGEWLPWTAAIAFAPVAAYLLWNVLRRSGRSISVRAVGFTELGLSGLVVIVALLYGP
jgi:hypothetical protein